MNKLITTPTGGFPFVLDDLRWIDDGIRDGFKGLASFLGTNCILSGVALTGLGTSTFTYTAGYILLDGEVLAIDASAAPLDTATNSYVYVELEESFTTSPVGDKYYENSGTAVPAYQYRKAVITAYSTAQAGKTTLVSLKTAENLISDMIVNYTHSYTKRQSWALGADEVISAASEIVPISALPGNSYNINIDAFDGVTALTRFAAPMPDGTWSAIRFIRTSGASQVIIEDGTATNNGIDTNGKSYLFNAGEIAWFIWTGGKARLVNGWWLNESWHIVNDSGEPAIGVNWAQTARPLKFRINELGDVIFTGVVSFTSLITAIFTLPIGYRPVNAQIFNFYSLTDDIMFQIQILNTGVVSVVTGGTVNVETTISFDNVRFSTL
jgi:hypothetical protein